MNLFESSSTSASQRLETTNQANTMIQMASPIRRRRQPQSKGSYSESGKSRDKSKLGQDSRKNKRQEQQQLKQQQTSRGLNDDEERSRNISNLLELPEADSLALQMARQRRPSVSNRTTISVDQQGKDT